MHTFEDVYIAYTSGDTGSAVFTICWPLNKVMKLQSLTSHSFSIEIHLVVKRVFLRFRTYYLTKQYFVDKQQQLLNLDYIFGLEDSEQKRGKNDDYHAFVYWSRSARQNNADSWLKLGDYYYHGIGVPVNYEKAAECYRVAAEIGMLPMAIWNLGYIYEHGLGVRKDFQLAKRAYESVLSTDPSAYLAVKLSLLKLYLKALLS